MLRISPYWAALLAAGAAVAGAARWLIQGTGNLYTATQKRFYVADPDFGWRVIEDGPFWLGLEILAGVVAAAVAVGAAAWFIQRRERRSGAPWPLARGAVWVIALVPWAVPLWAFSTGFAPEGAREDLPMEASQAKVAPTTISGTVSGAPKGTYHVVAHETSAITARISAGGEAFDTRFVGNLKGEVSFNPQALTEPVSAWVRVDAASANTGVTLRSKHATEYLKVEEHPELRITIKELIAAEQGKGPEEVAFWAKGEVSLVGKPLEVPIVGTIRALDDAGQKRLGVSTKVLLVHADFSIDLKQTALAGDAKDFDETTIPIRASLVLAHQP